MGKVKAIILAISAVTVTGVLLYFASPAPETEESIGILRPLYIVFSVLAGIILGLLAQGMSPFEAACAGVYLHAISGELARKDLGDAGMIASDILGYLPRLIQSLKQER